MGEGGGVGTSAFATAARRASVEDDFAATATSYLGGGVEFWMMPTRISSRSDDARICRGGG
jgi:hypothetical protein